MFGIGGIKKRLTAIEDKLKTRETFVTKEELERFKRSLQQTSTSNSALDALLVRLQSGGEEELRRLVREAFNRDFPEQFKAALADQLAELDTEGLLDEVDLSEIATKVAEKVVALLGSDSDWRASFVSELTTSLANELDWSTLEQAVADLLVERVSVNFNTKVS